MSFAKPLQLLLHRLANPPPQAAKSEEEKKAELSLFQNRKGKIFVQTKWLELVTKNSIQTINSNPVTGFHSQLE